MELERPTQNRRMLWLGTVRRARRPFSAACYFAVAILVGAPLYRLGDTFALWPPELRDRPWPFELLAIAACVMAARSTDVRRVRFSTSLLLLAIMATAAFSVHTRVVATTLPRSDPTLPVGQPLPSLRLLDHTGARVALRSGRPSLLVFFRATSCPFCRSQLSRIAEAAPRFLDERVQVIALSPDSSASLERLKTELGLPFVLLSDEDERAVSLLCGGKAHCQLLADTNGIIRWATLSESWSEVPAPIDLLQAAYRLRDEARGP